MRNSGMISENEKWRAVIDCDKQYDGLFYYAVKTTGIVCRPSCRAKTPLRENILFFNNISDAIKEGFRPCKLCRPDITNHDYEPNNELIQKVKEKLDQNYSEPLHLEAISCEFGISASHLTRLFKSFYGISPIYYIVKLRVAKAIEMFEQTDRSILDIAYAAGFRSLSNFYKSFKEHTGHTPNEYRRGSN
ncbi:bifunctional transcriptional activator/DNA repair enzyme AdaA [Clostridium omnivorum]|uniref:AraC family transcriptional regulator n=1 Tax=Clostridium omnivorum TaxID=1604902 RepID=A0ABQ5N9C8_9CLOT|nr:Ada metal-binding domain-containing protein [Clostridium sp. E14]GLC31704.1 AraC family transcriptional regulator [Clostridium sp. E14]